jgi:soluble lytic murein transglycosylase-like protein
VEAAAVDVGLACARAQRRAVARRALAARRAAAVRRARRLVVVLVVAASFLGGQATQAEKAPVAPRAPRWPRFSAAACGIPEQFGAAFQAAARDTHLPVALLSSVAWEESRMKPGARSSAGARGLLQLMPGTSALVAVTSDGARANVLAGARYLRRMLDRFGDNVALSLAAYDAGPTAVEQAGAAPYLETLRYALNVEARAASLTHCV